MDPGPIDNSSLIAESTSGGTSATLVVSPRAKQHLQEGVDYELLPECVWSKLQSWYGGGPPLERKVISEGNNYLRVEVFPLVLRVRRTNEQGKLDKKKKKRSEDVEDEEAELEISKKATLDELLVASGELLKLDKELLNRKADSIRIWNFFSANAPELITSPLINTLDEEKIVHGQLMVLELKMSDGTWPLSNALANNNDNNNSNSSSSGNANKTGGQGKENRGVNNNNNSNGSESGKGAHNSVSGSSKSSEKKEKKKGKGLFGRITSIFSGANSDNSSSSSSSSSGSSSSGGDGFSFSSLSAPLYQRGLCGLDNLGNTCFMNSALQCLSNTAVLNKYFVSDAYKDDINEKNPLGMKGELAKHFGALIKAMWSGQSSCVAPKNLKSIIGKKAPQFSGYQQHDSQELLAFLLDGLHEDLNRIGPTKPYVELPESNGRSDSEVATEAWEKHRLRDSSIIVDIFQGQLKSTVMCPEPNCKKVSITFDPFLFLSLPLPIENTRYIDIIHFRNDDASRPIKVSIKVGKEDTVGDLQKALAEVVGIKADSLILADITYHRIYGFLSPSRSVSNIHKDDNTFSYELADERGGHLTRVNCVHRKKSDEATKSAYRSPYRIFGLPFLFWFPSDITGRELYRLVFNKIKRFLFQAPVGKQDAEDQDGKPDDRLEGKMGDNVFPFELKRVNQTGMDCVSCTVMSTCFGCLIKCDDSLVISPSSPIKSGSTIALEWTQDSYKKYYDISKAESVIVHASAKASKEKKGVTLYDCINLFNSNERLGPNDPWYCPSCKEHRRAWKKFDLWRLPKVLIIHLKRFQYTRAFREKIGIMIDFPVTNLDLTPYLMPESPNLKSTSSPQALYDLFAVSNHSGGLGGGHYTAFAKNADDNEWYDFNDSSCKKTTASSVKTSAAYVLFYQLKEPSSSTTPTATNT
eukprot:TRINITY_DN2643_c1_g1_i1.p1 TRINITY_DN2643_c1_g1~~TRINITY_DN2643_c1_g1_i1.p1  ORF type:complete len:939 (-),score=214.91 TRINITY_DN2643_c1_g1_i1:15-2783(-)